MKQKKEKGTNGEENKGEKENREIPSTWDDALFLETPSKKSGKTQVFGLPLFPSPFHSPLFFCPLFFRAKKRGEKGRGLRKKTKSWQKKFQNILSCLKTRFEANNEG